MDKEKPSPLRAAVEALDEELQRFSHLADAARRTPLTSERNLDKAVNAVNQASEAQQRVQVHLQALIEAIATAQRDHDATAEALIKVRDEVQARTEKFQGQLGRFAELGKRAAQISGYVKELGDLREKPNGAIVADLGNVQERMGQIIEGAIALEKEAKDEAMEDLARQCDALRQQLTAALNKVTLLRDKLRASLS